MNIDLPQNYTKLNSKSRKTIRETYIEEQKGLCHYCRAELSGQPQKLARAKVVHPGLYPAGFFDNPVHLHHCHETGMTIGAVHAHCNAVLWEYEKE